MNKEQAVTYLKFSGFSDEQIRTIEGAFSCPSAGVDCEDCPAYEDAISREAVLKIYDEWFANCNIADKKESPKSKIKALPPVTPQPKMGHCKDCKWWKDSDGLYRRGGHAESQCPINRREVFEGNGYCYMFEPKESEG